MKQRDVPHLTGAGILPSTVWRLSPDWRVFQCQRGVYLAWSLPATLFNKTPGMCFFYEYPGGWKILRIEHFLLHLVEKILSCHCLTCAKTQWVLACISKLQKSPSKPWKSWTFMRPTLELPDFSKKNKPSFEEVTQKEGGKSLTKQKKGWSTRLTLNILRFPLATNSPKEMDWR